MPVRCARNIRGLGTTRRLTRSEIGNTRKDGGDDVDVNDVHKMTSSYDEDHFSCVQTRDKNVIEPASCMHSRYSKNDILIYRDLAPHASETLGHHIMDAPHKLSRRVYS